MSTDGQPSQEQDTSQDGEQPTAGTGVLDLDDAHIRPQIAEHYLRNGSRGRGKRSGG